MIKVVLVYMRVLSAQGAKIRWMLYLIKREGSPPCIWVHTGTTQQLTFVSMSRLYLAPISPKQELSSR